MITSCPPWELKRFLVRGFVEVPRERRKQAIAVALWDLEREQIERFWRCLFGPYVHTAPGDPQALLMALWDAVTEPGRRITVLERRAPGPRIVLRDKTPAAPAPLRPTERAHYIVVEAVSDSDRPAPVSGLRLQLVFGDGEARTAQTDAHGLARSEGIHSARVVIQVLGVDGKLWRPLDGEPAQPSGAETGIRWHEVQRGECLSHIAHRHGFDGRQALWDHPKNAPLRARRKSPHLLCPGDQLAISGIGVHEIVRAADATHRIAVKQPLLELKLRLSDHHGRPFRDQPYELHLPDAANDMPIQGTTNSEGQVQAWLPTGTTQVLVSLPAQGLGWPVSLSALPALPENARCCRQRGRRAPRGRGAGPAEPAERAGRAERTGGRSGGRNDARRSAATAARPRCQQRRSALRSRFGRPEGLWRVSRDARDSRGLPGSAARAAHRAVV